MDQVVHLTVAAVEAIHDETIATHGGDPGLSNPGLLESAIAATQATGEGTPFLVNPFEIAAAYLFYICKNHPFVDGNKRTALAAYLTFLKSNGLLNNPDMPVSNATAWEKVVLDVASGAISREETTNQLNTLLRHGEKRG